MAGEPRSRTIWGRSRLCTYAAVETLKPGQSSSVTQAPPTNSRRSRTSTRRPARARYAAVTNPLCPAPTTRMSGRSAWLAPQSSQRSCHPHTPEHAAFGTGTRIWNAVVVLHESSTIAGRQYPRKVSRTVARPLWRARGLSPRHGRAHRLSNRASLRCLLVSMDPLRLSAHCCKDSAT